MNALDAVTAHTVVNELGPLVARERLSHGTRFPLSAHTARRAGKGVWYWIKTRLLRPRAGHRVDSRLSAHIMRDIGINPLDLDGAVHTPAEDLLIRSAPHSRYRSVHI